MLSNLHLVQNLLVSHLSVSGWRGIVSRVIPSVPAYQRISINAIKNVEDSRLLLSIDFDLSQDKIHLLGFCILCSRKPGRLLDPEKYLHYVIPSGFDPSALQFSSPVETLNFLLNYDKVAEAFEMITLFSKEE